MARPSPVTALVLGSGPSLVSHRAHIDAFIASRHPVVLAANRAFAGLPAHYVGFTNRRRLSQYGVEAVAAGARLLIGSYIPSRLVRHLGIPDGLWERLPYVNDHEAPFGIEDGVILSECGGSGPLLIAVAAIMGCCEVWVAGMDGYPTGVSEHAYSEPDANEGGVLRHQDETARVLGQMVVWFQGQGIGGPWIMTPTVYAEHYRKWGPK